MKDNIDVAGLPTTAACPAFAYDRAAARRTSCALLAAGAILVGKTNLDQFADRARRHASPYGAVPNAFDARYFIGGSSSGSAVRRRDAAWSDFALGTDTAGSGRVPAGFNNIVGLKPTRGPVSTRGVVPACRTLDCVSIFALTRRRLAARVLRAAMGVDAARPVHGALPLDRAAAARALALRRAAAAARSSATRAAAASTRRSSGWRARRRAIVEIDFAPLRARPPRCSTKGRGSPSGTPRSRLLRRAAETLDPTGAQHHRSARRRYSAADVCSWRNAAARAEPARRGRVWERHRRAGGADGA